MKQRTGWKLALTFRVWQKSYEAFIWEFVGDARLGALARIVLDNEKVNTAFFDVDTQLDFVYPAGALYTAGAEDIAKPLDRLTAFAFANRIQVISTADTHSEDDPEFAEWKPHCVAGTTGHQKLAGTLLKDPLILTTAPDALKEIEPRVATASQIIVQKQKIDCFTNPNLKHLLASLGVERFVVYGVLTEFCVHFAIFGLLELGFQVEVATDAIKSFDLEKGRAILDRFQTAGGQLTTVDKVTGLGTHGENVLSRW